MQTLISNCVDDFLKGSDTAYNYTPFSNYRFFFYAQIAGIQYIGPTYYNELALAKEYLVQYTLEGIGRATINDIEYTLYPGDVLVIPNFQHRIFQPIEGHTWKIAFVHIFEHEYVAEIFRLIFNKRGYFFHNVDSRLLLPHIEAIINYIHCDSQKNESAISSQIYQLLMKLFDLSNMSSSETVKPELSNVLHFIQQNYHRPMRLSDIMAHASYSKNHLERLFKAEVHMTIHQYVSSLRLRRAQELISSTGLSCKEIAQMVGLQDYRALIYLFKTSLRITPTEYRALYRTDSPDD